MYYYPYTYPYSVDYQRYQPYYPLSFLTQYPYSGWDMYRQQNPFPPVNPSGLEDSAKRFKKLMEQAHLLIEKIAEEPNFAYNLMDAAQKSNSQKVNELIASTGVTIRTKTEFTPTGIHIVLENSEIAGGCCDMLIALRW